MKAQFDGDLRAPARAREFVATRLAAVVGDAGRPDGGDAVLIVSELVTNAVQAGAARIVVEVTARVDRIDLQVTDDAVGWPTPRSSGDDELGGRGLHIVEQLTDAWATKRRHPGKTVTATWFRNEP